MFHGVVLFFIIYWLYRVDQDLCGDLLLTNFTPLSVRSKQEKLQIPIIFIRVYHASRRKVLDWLRKLLSN